MATRYYAIKRPDGSWIMARPHAEERGAWESAAQEDGHLKDLIGLSSSATRESRCVGLVYRCCEVSGFVEVENG